MNLANGASGSYLYPPESSSDGIYQVWVSPFTKEALPGLTEACVREDRTVDRVLTAPVSDALNRGKDPCRNRLDGTAPRGSANDNG